MLNTNQFILAAYDTKNNVLVSNTISLENTQAYSVTFHVLDVTNAGLATDSLVLYVEALAPQVPYAASLIPGITLEVEPTNLLAGTEASLVWSATPTIDSAGTESMSDSGYGYKAVTARITAGTPSLNQFLVIAVLHTTKAPN